MAAGVRSRGLGDTIDKITTATGIKKVVDSIAEATGKDCRCAARKDKLNRAFPYSIKK
jgi:predicted transcriptional regulator